MSDWSDFRDEFDISMKFAFSDILTPRALYPSGHGHTFRRTFPGNYLSQGFTLTGKHFEFNGKYFGCFTDIFVTNQKWHSHMAMGIFLVLGLAHNIAYDIDSVFLGKKKSNTRNIF